MVKEKITCVIVEDEFHARKLLKKYIDRFGELELVGEFTNATVAVPGIEALQPALIFLDVQMQGKTGLEMLEMLNAPARYMIIFTTAYDQYLLKAFDNSAVDYLLKPFDEERFSQAIEKVTKLRPAFTAVADSERNRIQQLLMQYQFRPQGEGVFLERITCKFAKKLAIVPVKDVLYLEAQGNYVQAHTKERAYLLDVTISGIQEKLNPSVFVRIHRSTIVNTQWIVAIEPHFNGEYKIELQNTAALKVSRSYKNDFNKVMGVL